MAIYRYNCRLSIVNYTAYKITVKFCLCVSNFPQNSQSSIQTLITESQIYWKHDSNTVKWSRYVKGRMVLPQMATIIGHNGHPWFHVTEVLPLSLLPCHRSLFVMPWLHVKWNYFKIISEALLQLMNIFQHAKCRWNNFNILSELFQLLKLFYFSFRRGYVWNKNYYEIISVFLFHVYPRFK